MRDLNQLADRLQQIERGNPAANTAIWKSVFVRDYEKWEMNARAMLNRDASESEKQDALKRSGQRAAPDFTRSLDAAMRLVPSGYFFQNYSFDDQEGHSCTVIGGFDRASFVGQHKHSFCLGLIIASLRARACLQPYGETSGENS